MPFACSICEEPSTQICVRCTKDACANHLCVKCHRCSDCCECEEPVAESAPVEPVVRAVAAQPPVAVPVRESAAAAGLDALVSPEPTVEPAGVPAEDISGEAPDKNLA